jgi:hypothetical protein
MATSRALRHPDGQSQAWPAGCPRSRCQDDQPLSFLASSAAYSGDLSLLWLPPCREIESVHATLTPAPARPEAPAEFVFPRAHARDSFAGRVRNEPTAGFTTSSAHRPIADPVARADSDEEREREVGAHPGLDGVRLERATTERASRLLLGVGERGRARR